MSSASNYSRVWQIHQMLKPKPDDLISTSRFFIREGDLILWDEKSRKKKQRYFFLFNDVLLLTKKEKSNKKYYLRIHITLRSPYVNIEDVENSSYNHEFRLHCRARSFILYAPTAELRQDWVRDIQMSIKGEHPEEMNDKEIKKKSDDLAKNKSDIVVTKKKKKNAKLEESGGDSSEEQPDSSSEEESEEKKPTKKSASSRVANDATRARSAQGDKKKKKKNAGGQDPNAQLMAQMGFTSFDPFANPAAARVNHNPAVINSTPGFGTQPANPFLLQNAPTSSFGAGDLFSSSTFGTPPISAFGTPVTGGSLFGTPTTSQFGATASNPYSAQGASQFNAPNPFLQQNTQNSQLNAQAYGAGGFNSTAGLGSNSLFAGQTPTANPFMDSSASGFGGNTTLGGGVQYGGGAQYGASGQIGGGQFGAGGQVGNGQFGAGGGFYGQPQQQQQQRQFF